MSLEYATLQNEITAAKWFGIGVRLLGVWECLDELVTYGNVALRLYTPTMTSANGYLAHAVEHGLAGLFLLFGAANIVAASYAPRGAAPAEPIDAA